MVDDLGTASHPVNGVFHHRRARRAPIEWLQPRKMMRDSKEDLPFIPPRTLPPPHPPSPLIQGPWNQKTARVVKGTWNTVGTSAHRRAGKALDNFIQTK